jgi:hypothetical protein
MTAASDLLAIPNCSAARSAALVSKVASEGADLSFGLVIGISGGGAISGEIILGEYCYGKSLPERNMAGIAERPEEPETALLRVPKSQKR